jgi:hypothetical protein
MDEQGHLERLDSDESTVGVDNQAKEEPPEAATYKEVLSDIPTGIICLTGFFFQ